MSDGVLFGYAPELFPTPSRGTGDALVACCQRVFGLFAPIIAVYSPAADKPDVPVYTSGAIYLLYVQHYYHCIHTDDLAPPPSCFYYRSKREVGPLFKRSLQQTQVEGKERTTGLRDGSTNTSLYLFMIRFKIDLLPVQDGRIRSHHFPENWLL